ncbi:MAG: discoidin domain-containing protein [Candidatus Omnitrophota bacterium]
MNRKGMVLILTFIIMITLTVITASFLYMTSVQTRGAGYGIAGSKALWLAEAGVQKAIWNLMTPLASGGKGEDWITSSTTENLGAGSYTLKVERWDWCLAAHDSAVTASSSAANHGADRVTDNSDTTYWQSASKPSDKKPQYVTVTFPRKLTINKVRFLVPAKASSRAPRDYTWQVSADNITYTTVVTKNNNSSSDVTNEFSAAADVKYLRLSVTRVTANSGVRVASVEAIGAKITSTGTMSVMNRKISRTVAVHDGRVTVADGLSRAYDQIDWKEIVPAI